MRTEYKIRELLLPGNWNEEQARELMEEALEELWSACPECEMREEADYECDCECDCEDSDPKVSTYERLKKQPSSTMKIGDVDVVWESIEAAEPYDPRVTRATIWVDDETWKKHVKLGESK